MPHPALILDLEPSGGRALTDARPPNITLNPEEIRDAGNDGVDITVIPLANIIVNYRLRTDGAGWDGGYRHHGETMYSHMDSGVGESLDRVRLYWARRAKAETAAAKCAHHLSAALESAREHAQLFAAIADDGVFPIDRAQFFRAASAALGITIREIERCLNQYKVHGDVP
jgi:hypothetical protein